jgi:FixJ family two-component response regulator
MNQSKPLIALLDDEPQFCKALGRLLVACAAHSPSYLLLDLHMPGTSGVEQNKRVV